MNGTKTMFSSTDEFYKVNRPAALYAIAAAFAVWALILTLIAAI
jgi:hypothetical protein